MIRTSLIAGAVLFVLIVGSQLLLPQLAERRIRGDLRELGDVRSVSVRAFPAVKLLAERADRVEIRLGSLAAGTSRIGELVEMTRGVDVLDARAASLRVAEFSLRDLRLAKGDGGRELTGQAVLTDTALREGLPAAVTDFRPVETTDGQLVLEGTAGLLGVQATVRARLSAREGALVVAPEGLPLGGLATFTVFDDPRVNVTGVGATRTPDGYALTATAVAREAQ